MTVRNGFIFLFITGALGLSWSRTQLALAINKEKLPIYSLSKSLPLEKIKPFPYQKQHTISFTGLLDNASLIEIDLLGLEGSSSEKFGYYMALWQGDQIMDLSRAKTKQNILIQTQDGSFVFNTLGLSQLDYTLGLGVNNSDSTSFCATLIIPKNVHLNTTLNDSNAFFSSIKVLNIGSNSLIAQYKTPKFNIPKQNKNWVALFNGRFTSNMFLGTNLIQKTPIKGTTNNGTIVLNNIPNGLLVNQFYTLVYGMGYNSTGTENAQNIVAATEFFIPFR